jgi:hypothetical protein
MKYLIHIKFSKETSPEMTAWCIAKEIGGCHHADLRSVCFRDERWLKMAQHGVRLRTFLRATSKHIFMLLGKCKVTAFSVK